MSKFIQVHISVNAVLMRKHENREEFERMTNGCGPGGWKYDIVPDKIYGLSIKYDCNNHDIDWHFAKTWDEAVLANILFKKAVHSRIKNGKWILRGVRYVRFMWYYRAVNGKIAKKHFIKIKNKGK